MSELLSFAGDSGVRIFGYHGDASFCTCPAFYAHRQCFHIKGLQVFIGIATPAEALDATPVAIAARGNKPKAPGRGAVPLRADQKDVRLAHLEAQLRKLTSPKSQAAKKRPHSQVAQAQPASWTHAKRRTWRCSLRALVAWNSERNRMPSRWCRTWSFWRGTQ